MHAQYLTFHLSGELYAIGILSVKEIIGYGDVTDVPMMPPAIRGVINLRGAVVPVLDLAARFGRTASAVNKRTSIVIVELAQDGGGQQVIGIMVDAVSAVLDIDAAEIEPAPSFGARLQADCIDGIGKVNGKFVILLKLDTVLSIDELGALAEAEALA